jgi:outer membrane protein OmpA-like peptidoglycan-associated protein
MRFFLLLLILFSNLSFGQDLRGQWTGTLWQEPGRTFYFEMNIKSAGASRVKGTTVIRDDATGNYGVIEFNGKVTDSILVFEETEIVKEDRAKTDPVWKSNTFFWCIKNGELKFSQANNEAHLTGNWSSTGACQPGTISVSKAFEEKQKFKSIEDCYGDPPSAEFMYGMWTGKFTQYSCNINGTYDMILMIDEVDGMKFSGMFIWPASQFSSDSRSRLKGEIVNGRIYMSEPSQISGDPLVLKGTYKSKMTSCDDMRGYWHLKEFGTYCTDPQVLKDGGNYKLTHYKIPTIYFPHDSKELTQQSIKDLDELATFMKKFRNLKIGLEGYTDNTGPNAFNWRLSDQRAKVVRDYLIKKGVKSYRLKTSFYAQMKPAETNETEAGRVLNRRTEIKILKR